MPSNIIKFQTGGRFKADELRKLFKLLKHGMLTRPEFERLRRELLGQSGSPLSSDAPNEIEARDQDELDAGENLIAEALAMLAEPEARANLSAANVVRFAKRN